MNYYNDASPISTLKNARAKFETELYKVSVPVIATMSDAELNLYGMYVSGNKDVDRTASTEMTNIMIPAKDILEYFKQGATIRLVNNNDIKDIYTTIQNYLVAWKTMLENGINLMDTPDAELIELDELANEVFSRARFYFDDTEVENIIAQHFTELSRFTANNFFSSSVSKAIEPTKENGYVATDKEGRTIINSIEQEDTIERESLSDFFKKRIYNTRFHRDN